MAHQSRLNTFRLNTSYSGLYVSEFFIFINGVDRTNSVILESFVSVARQDGPCQCTFDVRNLEVTAGQEVIVRDGGSGTSALAGRVLARTRVVSVDQVHGARSTEIVIDRVTSTDWWFLDRFDKVTALYGQQPVNSIVADILETYTDGGYAVGDVDGSLGPVELVFTYESVVDALLRIAKAVGGHLIVHPRNKHVSILTSVADGHAITLDDSATDYWGFRYSTDISQIRTRVIVEGRGSTLRTAAKVGATTLELESVDQFDVNGGRGRLQDQEFVYTSKDTVTRTLTGVTGVTIDGAVNDEVNLVVRVDDAAAQTALATVLGGGASGVVTHYIRAPALTISEAAAVATEDLAQFSAVIPAVQYMTRNKFTVPGKTVTISRTSPRTISETAVIESVSTTTRGLPKEGDLRLEHAVSASPDELRLIDVLSET